ncbi:catechol 2,3-dioxygenase-like lactoylglutathione lyase family enzyme [Bradyrhizobium sp. AZCC 1588]|uniref:VOC family protein n=1 Tax=unclassified Bradyrhizobium TaxID=2631580 RepID=UPI002FF15FE2
MGLGGLQHYTIEPADLERTKDFYCDVLGLENGDRPPLDFPAIGSIPAARPRCI